MHLTSLLDGWDVDGALAAVKETSHFRLVLFQQVVSLQTHALGVKCRLLYSSGVFHHVTIPDCHALFLCSGGGPDIEPAAAEAEGVSAQPAAAATSSAGRGGTSSALGKHSREVSLSGQQDGTTQQQQQQQADSGDKAATGGAGAAKRLRRAAPSKPPTTRGSLAGGGGGVEPRSSLVGTRLGIYWELDKIYYRVRDPGEAVRGVKW